MTKVQTAASWETKSPLSIPGIILSDIGLEPFIDKLQELLQPLGEGFFHGPGSFWDGHHCFIVRYREGGWGNP